MNNLIITIEDDELISKINFIANDLQIAPGDVVTAMIGLGCREYNAFSDDKPQKERINLYLIKK